MATILNNPSFGGRLAESLGTGLQRLAESKLSAMTLKKSRSETASGLAALGIPHEQANAISSLDADLQKEYVKQHFSRGSQEEFARGLQAILGSNEQPQLGSEQAIEQPSQELGVGASTAPSTGAPKISGRLNEKQAGTLGKLALQKNAPKEAEQAQIRKEDRKKRADNLESSKNYFKEQQAKDELATYSDTRLNRMEELINGGKLPPAAWAGLIDKLEHSAHGIFSPIGALLKGGTKYIADRPQDWEEFEKLSADFVKDAKAIFGSRITDRDLDAFFRTIPTLSQTDEGKKVIIRNMKAFNNASRIKYNIARDIIKEEGGYPENLEEEVSERASPALNEWSKEFVKVS